MREYDLSLFPCDSAWTLKTHGESSLKTVFWDLNDRIIFSNNSFNLALELTDPELHSVSILDLIEPKHRDLYLAAKKSFLDPLLPRTDLTKINVNYLARPSSHYQAGVIEFSVARSADGTPKYFRAVLRDQTESQQQFENEPVLNQSMVTISAVNKDGFFIHCKGGLSRNFALDIVGRHFSEIYPEAIDSKERILRAISGESFDVEVHVEGFWYHIWYEPLKNSNGEISGALWTSHPIGKQKYAEMRLKTELRHKEEAVELREELLSMASHEIRSPLSTIAMQIDLLQSNIKEGFPIERLQNNVNMLANSGKKQITRVFDFVEKTLDTSRIHEHGLTLDLKKCDLAELVRETAKRSSERCSKAGCEIQITTPEVFTGIWDPFRMEQVVENLLSNAIKYGRGHPVSIRLKSNLENAILEVQDQGSGICPEEQKIIFQRFMRATEHKNMSGFGMGLYIVQQIVQAHQGSIRVTSEVGKGATFRVEIPLNVLETSPSAQLQAMI